MILLFIATCYLNIISSHMAACTICSTHSYLQALATQWTVAHQASLSLTIPQSMPKFMSTASMMPSSQLILWCPLLLLPSIFHSIRNFSNISIPWFLFTFRSWLFQWIKFQHDFKIICTTSNPVELNSRRIYARTSTNGLNWKLFLQTSGKL